MSPTARPSLSTHVLDTEQGRPAAGVPIALTRLDGQSASLFRGETDADGRIRDFGGNAIEPGLYRLEFDAAAYFRRRGGDAPFLSKVTIDFQVASDGGHYHVPLLLSRYACSSYRGS
jgi:5-hydroxyisourate hydrolase